MYVGHVGIALGAHGLRRSAPLWFLIIASQLPDWTDAAFCLGGVRPSIPGILSHSLPAVGVLALLAAVAYAAMLRDPAGMLLVGAVVLTHAAGDYLTGIKPTWSGGPMIGLLLYRRPVLDFLLEASVILGGWSLYRRSLEPKRRSAEPVYTLLAVLVAIQACADIVLSFAGGLRKC
jgi:LexA-binding, inner membrane-associated putative hydrolase